MAKKVLEDAVTTPDDGGSWDFRCPVNTGCGEPGGAGFESTGWPTRKVALARGQQHFYEHTELAPMQSLDDFRRDQGLTVDADGVVTVKDL